VIVYVLRRLVLAAFLIVLVSSGALLLVEAAPGDAVDGFDLNPDVAAAERHRLGLDRSAGERYREWLLRAIRFDFGNSVKYNRPVTPLVVERASKTALLGASALVLATLIGIPAGIFTGSRRNAATALARGVSLLFVSIPPLVTSLALLMLAARTGWFPVGGFPAADAPSIWTTVRYLTLPAIALALPIAATLERLQSQAMEDALAEPSVRAALARGCSNARIVWRHGFRLSLRTVLGLYGAIVGTVLSGSFGVEIVTSWPGLGALMYEGLVARDLYLVAGCAAAGAFFLAIGILLADIALALVDPRVEASA
jgi:peptide/nickel transport system permease protein